MKQRGEVPDDAVFINGNSGDFISGNHIHPSLLESRPDLTWPARKERVFDAYLDKHFSLWRDLRTPDNDRRVRNRAAAALDEALTGPVPAAADHGLYEFLECQERQAKFVISGQRVYEFFGHAWRLPLWDKDYLDFWRVLPLSAKTHQRLYRTMLIEANWGGVWDTIPINAKSISPAWIRPLRALAKIACAPLGENVWRGTEKHVFAYWTDLLSTYAAVPYRRLLFDRRGFRNAIALRCEAYLASKGLGWDGRPEPGHACGS
jgi:asparagine synthase (glutamine-hydrolysing)